MAYEKKSVRSVISDINSRKIYLPAIQRKYVWDDDQITRLMHPENASAYHLGCTMGIILAVIAVVTLVTFAALLIISKTGNKGSRRR